MKNAFGKAGIVSIFDPNGMHLILFQNYQKNQEFIFISILLQVIFERMHLINLLNRLSFTKLDDFLFFSQLPVLIGTARGGHTSLQNWLNVSILDYLGIKYHLSPINLSVNFKNPKSVKPLEPLDLRSCINFKNPLWGYIANDPGHALRLKNRTIFVAVRDPLKTFQSLKVLAKEVYKLNERKAHKYALNYLSGWSNRFSKLLLISKSNNLKIEFFKSEDIFESPFLFIKIILDNTFLNIPEESIKASILKYNIQLSEIKKIAPLSNPRQSYKSSYQSISSKDENIIKALFLYEFYNRQVI